jgi:hypothetical protein
MSYSLKKQIKTGFCEMTKHNLVQFNTEVYYQKCCYLYQSNVCILFKVAWGGDAHVCTRVAINLMLRGCQNIGEVLLRKGFQKTKKFHVTH